MADLLLIDDEETLLATLQLELQRAGHHVVAVNNATEGLQALESFEPSVALVDIKLPDIDGVEVIERVRALGYDFPIIVMTAYGSVGGAVEAMVEGNRNVILCERGIRSFADHIRFTLDVALIPALQARTHLPIVVDPSHESG